MSSQRSEAALTKWDDFDYSLWWGAGCRLEARAAAVQWGKKPGSLRGKKALLEAKWYVQNTRTRAQTSHSCILQLLNLLRCERQSIGARGGVGYASLNGSLSALHALLLPLKGPSRPLQKKSLCCLCQRTDLCSSAWSAWPLTLRRWAGRRYLEESRIDF